MNGSESDDDFNISSYARLLKSFAERDYVCVDYENVDPAHPHLILRHDLDFSVQYSLAIAEKEAALGLHAHYYVLVSSDFYNVMEPGVRSQVRQLSRLGHHIGLHFDTAAYAGTVDDMEEAAERETDILQTVADCPIESISFHRPIRDLVGRAGTFAGRLHTYEPRFVEEVSYVSDSRGAWRFGHPLDSEAFEHRKAIHLLTHPIWWYRDVQELPGERVQRFLSERGASQSINAANDCSPYREFLEMQQ